MRRSSASQRLPVNHRRHRVAPENRKRVSTACNSCNVRRIRCSGERPCSQCKNASRDCAYPDVVEKIHIPRSELDELRARCARLEQCLEQAVPDDGRREHLVKRLSLGTYSGGDSGSSTTMESKEPPEDEQNATEGRLLADPDGTARYLGSTSGATFLDLLKEFMHTMMPLAWSGTQMPEMTFLGSLGQYQTFDSRPLPIRTDIDPFWLPGRTEMTMMTAQLRFFLQDGSGDFPSGGIYYWGDLDPSFFDSKPFDVRNPDPQTLRRLALFHAAFALECQLEAPSEAGDATQKGEMYFARARQLLGNPLDTTAATVWDIPVLAMLSTYLVERNRRDTAYIYVSLGMHLAIMHGAHRGWVYDEAGKRAFWTLYVLDRWLSVLLGRPPAILDEAIRLPPPEDVPGLPPAAGLSAHVELSKISGYIVCNTYRVAPSENQVNSTDARIETALDRLSSWVGSLPPALQMPASQFSNDRACCELHMAYNQLLILTTRPIFFVAVKRSVAQRFFNRNWDPQSHAQIAQIKQCGEAARRNLRLGRQIRNLTPGHKLISRGLHNIFNAAIILLLHQLLFDTLDDQDARDIGFTIECFDVEARGESNYPKDCGRVLRDLSMLVQRVRNRGLDDFAQIAGSSGGALTTQPSPTTPYHVDFILNPDMPGGNIPAVSMPPVATTHPLYNEIISLSSWMEPNELPMYSNYIV